MSDSKFPPRLFGAKGDVLPVEADYISVAESDHREKEAYTRGRAEAFEEAAGIFAYSADVAVSEGWLERADSYSKVNERLILLAKAARAETEGLGE